MEVISFNTNMQKVAIVDSYKSFIWNDRYENGRPVGANNVNIEYYKIALNLNCCMSCKIIS